jgi:hypothetical protein
MEIYVRRRMRRARRWTELMRREVIHMLLPDRGTPWACGSFAFRKPKLEKTTIHLVFS